MATFNVTYPDGTEKVEVASDCETKEQFINSRFGTSSGLDHIKVELVDEAEAPKPKPTTPSAPKAKK